MTSKTHLTDQEIQELITRAVVMTATEYAEELHRLMSAEAAAYHTYLASWGAAPALPPGAPQHIGHGSHVAGGRSVRAAQTAWGLEKHAMQVFRAARRGARPGSWTRNGDRWTVTLRGVESMPRNVEIVTHGVDTTAAATPWDAVRMVREAFTRSREARAN